MQWSVRGCPHVAIHMNRMVMSTAWMLAAPWLVSLCSVFLVLGRVYSGHPAANKYGGIPAPWRWHNGDEVVA